MRCISICYSLRLNVRRKEAKSSPRERDPRFNDIQDQKCDVLASGDGAGDCFDTSRFAVETISDWWWREGCRRFARATRLLILADAGGWKRCHSRVWNAQPQEQLCDACRLTVTVCHYPTGCSKWNPVEHWLFGHISLNWEGACISWIFHVIDSARS